MEFKISPRKGNSKSETNRLRREGMIPAVIYSRGKTGALLAIQKSEFASFLRNLKPGHLPTSVFTLVDEKGHKHKAIIKDIQYNIINYEVSHLDFEELVADHKVKLKVPIECVGAAECPGIKLGGALRQVLRHVRVACLPKDMPTFFQLDVRDLSLGQSKRLRDLGVPNTIKPLANENDVVAVIVKR